MKRLLLLLSLLLAACGGADQREYGTGSDTFREQPLALDIAGTFSRASPAFVQDWEGVWIPLDVDEPGFIGARRVKNLYLHSDSPAQWEHLLLTSDSTTTLEPTSIVIHHAAGQRGSPYLCNKKDGDEPGVQMPSIFGSRADVQVIAGPTADKFSPVGRTNGAAIGSESNNPGLTLDLATTKTLSQTAQQFERHSGWCQTYLSSSSVARSYRVSRVQFEDLSGAKTPVSGEYCPSTDKPGICWHSTARPTSRGGKPFDAFDENGVILSGGGGGVLTESAAPASLTGDLTLQEEPESTNRALWNALGHVGTAVLDGASTTHLVTIPAALGATSILTDPRSERLVYNKNDIATDQDQITSITTDLSAFRAGESVWLHIPSLGAVGPVVIAQASPHLLRVLSLLPTTAKGQKIGIQRVPGIGDQIVVGLNGGIYQTSTVTGVTLPSVVGVLPQNLSHQSVRIDIADPLIRSGGAAGANGNLPVYYTKTLPATIVRGTGATVRLVRDDSVIQAGLGYLSRTRLVLELKAGSDYAMFDLDGVDGAKGPTAASAWAKTVSGKASQLNLKAHSGGPFTTAEWQRLIHATNNVNGTGQVRLVVPAWSVVRVALPQVELGDVSSPIVTQGLPATRAATLINTGAN